MRVRALSVCVCVGTITSVDHVHDPFPLFWKGFSFGSSSLEFVLVDVLHTVCLLPSVHCTVFVRLREARERPRSVAWQHDASAMISLNPPESFAHIFGSSGAARSDRTGAERLRRY